MDPTGAEARMDICRVVNRFIQFTHKSRLENPARGGVLKNTFKVVIRGGYAVILYRGFRVM